MLSLREINIDALTSFWKIAITADIVRQLSVIWKTFTTWPPLLTMFPTSFKLLREESTYCAHCYVLLVRLRNAYKKYIQLDLWCNRKRALHISHGSGWSRCSWSKCSNSSHQLQKLHSTPTVRSERCKQSLRWMSKSPTSLINTRSNSIREKSEKGLKKASAHIFLCEVNQVLKINVIPVSSNVVVNEKVKLILYPVLENEGQNSCGQLQEEDDTQEHWELKYKNSHHFNIKISGK